MARARRDWRERFSPLVAVLTAVLLILILPPTLYLIATSFYSTRPDGAFDQLTLRYYRQLFTNPYFASSLLNTVVYAAGSALVAIVLAFVSGLTSLAYQVLWGEVSAAGSLALAGIPFSVVGSATYEQYAPTVRDPAASPVQ
jgi:ABC-type spermidine/putrescine transport system permease subunit II